MGVGTTALLAGCGGSNSSSSSTGSAGGDPADVSGDITFLCALFEGATGKETLEGNLLKTFNQQYPNINVTIDYTNYSKLNEKITTALAGGLMPDVLTLGVGWIPPFANKHAIAPIADSLATRYAYQSRVLEPARFDGNLYGLPMVLDVRVGAYRKDFFAEAGIDAPPTNWTDLRKFAKELTVRDSGGSVIRAGFDPFSIDLRQGWETFLFANGGEMFSEDGREVLFGGDEGVEALQLYIDLVGDGSAIFANETPEKGMPSSLQSGNSAMMMTDNSLMLTLLDQAPELIRDDKVGWFAVANPTPAIFQGGTIVSQSATSKHPEAAAALVEFLGGQDAVLAACAQRGSVPGMDELLTSDFVAGNPFVKFALENLDKSRPEGGTPAWMEIREKIKPTLQSAVVGQQSARAAIDELTGIAEAAIARL
ncbi:ABC transporter substrate-binding protein [Brooklawnia cerclae]